MLNEVKRDGELCPVKVFCRIRPIKQDPCIEVIDQKTIKVRGIRGGFVKETNHTFSKIFSPSVGQSTVFHEVASPLIEDFLCGHNSLLFTYGVTGSGKTYTIRGTPDSPGILSRSLDTIFNSVGPYLAPKYAVKSDGQNGFFVQSESDALVDKQRLDYEQTVTNRRIYQEKESEIRDNEPTSFNLSVKDRYSIFIIYYEIYNNYIYDLINDDKNPSPKARSLREDNQHNVYVSGLVEKEIRCASEGVAIFKAGQKSRHMGSTDLNKDSSRSHSIFTIKLVRTKLEEHYQEIDLDDPCIRVSNLSLVDLAGSERTNKAKTAGERLKEASNINNSLMTLRKCIHSLRENQKRQRNQFVVPFRDSKLTHLFKNYFEGDGNVRMIICLKPVSDQTDEILHVLKFAEASQDVSTVRSNNVYGNEKENIAQSSSISSGYHSQTNLKSSNIIEQDSFERFLQLPINLNKDLKKLREELAECLKEINLEDLELNKLVDQFVRYPCDLLPYEEPLKDFLNVDEQVLAHCNQLDLIVTAFEKILSQMEYSAIVYHNCDELFRSTYLNKVDERLVRLIQHDEVEMHTSKLERNHLKSQIQKLERDLMEKSDQLKIERSERLKLTETHRVQLRQLRDKCRQIEKADLLALQTPRHNPPITRKPMTGTVSTLSKRFENKMTAATPSRATPAFNSRHDNRSRKKSGNSEVWLEHLEKNPVAMGTIMTPKLRRKKSTSTPNMKDACAASNYLLHHQEALPDGSVETMLYKGNVIPTAGGGAAVIFDDVEAIIQKSPLEMPRKTRSGVNYSNIEEDKSIRLSLKRSNSNLKSDISNNFSQSAKRHQVLTVSSSSGSSSELDQAVWQCQRHRGSSIKKHQTCRKRESELFEESISPPRHLAI